MGNGASSTQDAAAGTNTQVTEATGGAVACLGETGEEDGALADGGEGNVAGKNLHAPGYSKWSAVVKNGKRQPGAVKSGAPGSRKPGKRLAIVGTGAASHIKTVTTKLVSVFASKFSPDLDVETLTDFLKVQLCREVTCQKIATANSRFASFKVTAECKDVVEMYNPDIWPVGTYVRRFYEPRSRAVGSNRAGVGAQMSGAPLACGT